MLFIGRICITSECRWETSLLATAQHVVYPRFPPRGSRRLVTACWHCLLGNACWRRALSASPIITHDLGPQITDQPPNSLPFSNSADHRVRRGFLTHWIPTVSPSWGWFGPRAVDLVSQVGFRRLFGMWCPCCSRLFRMRWSPAVVSYVVPSAL